MTKLCSCDFVKAAFLSKITPCPIAMERVNLHDSKCAHQSFNNWLANRLGELTPSGPGKAGPEGSARTALLRTRLSHCQDRELRNKSKPLLSSDICYCILSLAAASWLTTSPPSSIAAVGVPCVSRLQTAACLRPFIPNSYINSP